MTEPTIQLRPVRLGKMLRWYATVTSDEHAYLAKGATQTEPKSRR